MGTTARMPGRGEPVRLAEIVARLGGTLRGPGETQIWRVASLQNAVPGDISFLSDIRYRSMVADTKASALILPSSLAIATPVPSVVCDEPYAYFAEVARMLTPAPAVVPGRHPSAVIETDAMVSEGVQIDANVYVGHRTRVASGVVLGPGCCLGDDVSVGTDSRLYASVTVYKGCRIGRRAIIHAGAVIGADGFGMALKEGRWLKIPQTGAVQIGDDVEIGANTTIDRGALDDTVIGDGVKLDNLIQVGHNVHIGAHTAIAGCAGIAGSARIGRHCTIGGGAIILGHLDLADHVNVSAATLITKSLPRPGRYTGAFPFDEHARWGRSAATLRGLAELMQRLRQMENLIATGPAGDAPQEGKRAVRSRRASPRPASRKKTSVRKGS